MQVSKKLLVVTLTSLFMITACGGGSSGGSSPADNSGNGSGDGSGSGDSGNGSGGNNTITDSQITDQGWISGEDKMVDMVWPYGDSQVGAPVYLIKQNTSSNTSKILKGTAATTTGNAEDFSELKSFTGTNVAAIEAYRFIDANRQPDRLIYTCDNSTSPAEIRIYKESDMAATPASLPLNTYYQLNSTIHRKKINICESLSIGGASTSTSGFEVTLYAGGTGTDSAATVSQFHIAKAVLSYNINATGELNTAVSGGSPTFIYQLSTYSYHVKAMHAVNANSVVVAYTAPVPGENRVRLIRQWASPLDLIISTQNKFDGTTSLWQVADMHVWTKSANDTRVYMTSPGGGTFAISFDQTALSKNGDHTFTTGDAQHCGDVITGFRSPTASPKLWCQDSTDKAELLEFTAPDLPVL